MSRRSGRWTRDPRQVRGGGRKGGKLRLDATGPVSDSHQVPTPTAAGASPTRRVVVVVFDRFQSLDALGPIEVFDHANGSLRQRAYQLDVAAPDAGPVAASSGVTLAVEHALADIVGPIDTLVVAGGLGVYPALRDPAVVAHIRRLAGAARRVTSVCTGAYLLAEAGLLAGHRVTTHWMSCADLQERYPDLDVDPEPIFIREGNLATSAGVTAGMDLALHLVEEDHGHALALEVARSLVLFLRRPGTQAQLSAVLAHQATASAPLRELQQWVVEHLDEDLTVARLAARAHQSPRTFARRFRDDVGTTPARWVEGLRLEEARRLLETTTEPVDQVARRCGLQPEAIRRLFHRNLGVGPSEYRRRFGTPIVADRSTSQAHHRARSPHRRSPHRRSRQEERVMTAAEIPTVGIILFEGAEELDWAGPWEVFTLAGTNGALRAVTIAEGSPVTSAKGLRVLPDHSFDDAPPLDVIVVPGGLATREQVDNER